MAGIGFGGTGDACGFTTVALLRRDPNMCGIAGVLAPQVSEADAGAMVRPMLARLTARGPEGTTLLWRDGVTLGHTRLAFTAPDGNPQPVETIDGRYALAFNGEIYNSAAIARWLGEASGSVAPENDAQLFLALWQREGAPALGRIDGMFAVAVHDRLTGALVLARDRFGEKPLYWGRTSSGAVAFASQLNALGPAIGNRISPEGLVSFLRWNAVGWPGSLLADTAKVAPGSLIEFRQDGSVRHDTWWVPDMIAAPPGDVPLETILRQSVAQRLDTSAVPLGLFLSGGLDSALVAAAAVAAGWSGPAFTAGFESRSFDETDAAIQTARSLGLDHRILRIGDGQLVSAAGHLLDSLDEPIADPGLLALWLLVSFARDDVKGALGGDGADDLFLGYPFYATLPFYAIADRIGHGPLRALAARLRPGTTNMHPALVANQLLRGVGVAGPARFPEIYGAFDANELASILVPALSGRHCDVGAGFAPWPGALFDPADRYAAAQAGMLRHFLSDVILTKLDRASMLQGFEIRSPFLATALATKALGLPRRAKFRGGVGKRPLQSLARQMLPSGLPRRSKKGFRVPLGALLRGPLAADLRHTLLEPPRHSRLFRPEPCARLIEEHVAGTADHQKKLWALMGAQRWADRMVRL